MYQQKSNEKIEKLRTFDLHYFCSNNGFQIIFVYQPTFSSLELKEDERTEYVIG